MKFFSFCLCLISGTFIIVAYRCKKVNTFFEKIFIFFRGLKNPVKMGLSGMAEEKFCRRKNPAGRKNGYRSALFSASATVCLDCTPTAL